MSYSELNDIYGWFQTGKTPTELQFQKTFSSFYHKSEQVPITAVAGLNALFQQTATLAALNAHVNSTDPHTAVLAKKDASNLTDIEAGQWIDKLKLNELYLAISDYVTNGKLRADKIEALGLTELISVTQTSLSAFMANNANYTYEKNDMIAIPDGAGNYSLYIYKGGSKTTAGNYIPTGLTNITISMVQGLQTALDSKLDKPTMTANYSGKWNGTNFVNGLIYDNSSSVGIGTAAPTPATVFDVQSTGKVSLPAPRMTQVQRLAIALSSLAAGGLVYQTDGLVGYYLWDGAAWKALGINISNADLTNTTARTFTQNAAFTWETLGNAYYWKGLNDVGSNYSTFSKVLRLNPATKEVAVGDSLIVTIPDTLPSPATPSVQTLTIVHTYTNSPTALDTNVQALNDFIMNIGNLQFINLTASNWFIANVNGNTSPNTSKTGGINLHTNTPKPTGTLMAYAYPDLVLPNNKNWCFIINGNAFEPNGNLGGTGLIGITEGSNSVDIGALQGFLSSFCNNEGNTTNNINNPVLYGTSSNANYISKGQSTIIWTKVGNILNITVRCGQSVKTLNVDVTGVNSFKPLLNMIAGHPGYTGAIASSDYGKYYIAP